MTFFDDVGKFWADSQKNINKFMNDVGDWYGKTNKDVNDWILDRYYNILDVVNTYQDVLDNGVAPQDYKSWMSFLPFFDKIQKYQDKQLQWNDYYKRTGKYPAYTSNIPTFGSTSQLASGLFGEASDIAQGLYRVGKLSKRL